MDPKTILKTLKDASLFDIFLISFIALPFVFEAWLRILEKLDLGFCAKYWSLVIVLLLYFIGIVLVLIGQNRQIRRELAKDEIINYLTRKNFEMMTLETVRKNINQSYDDAFLNSLPVHFPDDIRRARLKDGKPGVARIIESNNGAQ